MSEPARGSTRRARRLRRRPLRLPSGSPEPLEHLRRGRALYEFADGVHVEESDVRFFGFRVATRMAAIPLKEGELLLYSPTWLTDPLRGELDRLGRVAFILSPNKIHNQTLPLYRSPYPQVRIFAPPGLPERRPGLDFAGVLDAEPRPEWSETLDQALTDGNVFFSEALLFHRPSRTLLVGDLVENFEGSTASWLARLMARPFGVRQRPMPSPEFRFYTHDAAAAARSLARARSWPIERIFLCHGGLITRDAMDAFDSVCEELLAAARRRGRFAKAVFGKLADWQ